MIIEMPDNNSVVRWKKNDNEKWKYAEISDLIKAYEKRPQGDCISREALKEILTIQKTDFLNKSDNTSIENDKLAYRLVATGVEHALDCINIIPTIPQVTVFAENADEKAVEDMKAELQNVIDARPEGECKTCIHRDPEDKKCDCGALERQGCPFPVSDDYFCKFYKKRW